MRKRTCKGKRRYRDHDEAVTALHKLRNKSTRSRVPSRPYECPVCKGWHVTSQEKR